MDDTSRAPDGRRRAEPVSATVLAALLEGIDPTAAFRLLDLHVSDRHGRCRGCALPQTRGAEWPCLTRKVAEEARDRTVAGRRRR